MQKTLIIKLGARGDVLRTTPLLNVLKGEVYWITQKKCIPLLKQTNNLKKIVDLDSVDKELQNVKFDLIISLDEDIRSAKLATEIQKNFLIGSYLNNFSRITYTRSSREWFDMSLISKLGKDEADKLKKFNNKTYQEITFGMLGKKFNNQRYLLNFKSNSTDYKNKEKKKTVGIETRTGKRWPTKQWNKYTQLGDILRKEGKKVFFFEQRNSLYQYINDINKCDLIITGDTLALHIALALKIKTVAIFTCTSPAEIYGYGIMSKIVSPALEQAFYKTAYIKEAVDSVSLESIFKAVKGCLNDD